MATRLNAITREDISVWVQRIIDAGKPTTVRHAYFIVRMVLAYVAAISQQVGENGWPRPLPDELKDDLKSTVADLAMSAVRGTPECSSRERIREFVADGVAWADIDIAAGVQHGRASGLLMT